MSKKGIKSEYIILALLLCVSIVFGIYSLSRNKYESKSVLRTTLSNNVEGLVACYVLFERLGISVMRSHDPLVEGVMDGRIDVLFVINPFIRVNDGEIRHLRDWVNDGGVLVCTSDCRRLLEHVGAGKVDVIPYRPTPSSIAAAYRSLRILCRTADRCNTCRANPRPPGRTPPTQHCSCKKRPPMP